MHLGLTLPTFRYTYMYVPTTKWLSIILPVDSTLVSVSKVPSKYKYNNV